MKFRKWTLVALTLAAALAITVSLSAQNNLNPKFKLTMQGGGDDPSEVIVYSDSLADNGNIYKLFGFPGPPYWNGRWSNGPVAIEDMAAILGMPLLDYAYAATTTGLGNLIDGGTPEQLGSLGLPGITTAYNTTINSIPSDTIRHSLFVVYGGFNDFTSDGLTTATADHAVANLVAIVADLQKRGARWILVPGLLDMGMTPNYTSQGPQTAALATSLSKYLNQNLVAALPKSVLYFDTFSLYQAMRNHPRAFGLTDVVDQCYDPSTNTACPNPNQYLFWDFVHPTEHVQVILAAGFAFAAYGFDLPALPVAAQAEP
ncbi:MAG: SGNH/GDSL hydrolase family protein [Candidatus Korobacteraceae bacterium]